MFGFWKSRKNSSVEANDSITADEELAIELRLLTYEFQQEEDELNAAEAAWADGSNDRSQTAESGSLAHVC
ncbi:MAG: hypothetical protein N2C14_31100 [Planctomycetales bacterium]